MCLYLCVRGARVPAVKSRITARIFQTEAGLVTLCDLESGADVQQIIVTERIHAVIVPVRYHTDHALVTLE